MKSLIECNNCKAQISDTAIKCPICFKETGDNESLKSKIGLAAAGVAGLLIFGPLGIASGLMAAITGFASDRKLQKVAKKQGVIDSFQTTDSLILVTEKEFFRWINSLYGPIAGFPRTNLINAYIDESKSKSGGLLTKETAVLHLDYYALNASKETSEDFVFKGKNSRASAEWALVKFKEYQMSPE